MLFAFINGIAARDVSMMLSNIVFKVGYKILFNAFCKNNFVFIYLIIMINEEVSTKKGLKIGSPQYL